MGYRQPSTNSKKRKNGEKKELCSRTPPSEFWLKTHVQPGARQGSKAAARHSQHARARTEFIILFFIFFPSKPGVEMGSCLKNRV